MSRMILRIGAFLIASAAVATSSLAEEPVLPRPSAATHALDSLLGMWSFIEEVHKPSVPARVTGIWTFSVAGDGNMIIDEFRSFNRSGGTAIVAETYRAYNPATKKWNFQAILFDSPLIGLKSGEWDAGVTRIEDGQIVDEISQGPQMSRARFSNLQRDTFFCVLETSHDGGTTWVDPIEIKAVRARE